MFPMSKTSPPSLVPTEVTEKTRRRSFSAEYKRKILAEVGACTQPGGIGAILRREGLYSSHLVDWRRARDRGDLGGATTKRGPKARPADERDARIVQLERINAKLERRAVRAEALVELQKKVAELLGTSMDPDETP